MCARIPLDEQVLPQHLPSNGTYYDSLGIPLPIHAGNALPISRHYSENIKSVKDEPSSSVTSMRN
jgi:hypothetical protein